MWRFTKLAAAAKRESTTTCSEEGRTESLDVVFQDDGLPQEPTNAGAAHALKRPTNPLTGND